MLRLEQVLARLLQGVVLVGSEEAEERRLEVLPEVAQLRSWLLPSHPEMLLGERAFRRLPICLLGTRDCSGAPDPCTPSWGCGALWRGDGGGSRTQTCMHLTIINIVRFGNVLALFQGHSMMITSFRAILA